MLSDPPFGKRAVAPGADAVVSSSSWLAEGFVILKLRMSQSRFDGPKGQLGERFQNDDYKDQSSFLINVLPSLYIYYCYK